MYVHLVTAVIVYILTFSFMDVPVFQTGTTTCSYLTVCKGYPKSEPVLAENIFFICLIFEFCKDIRNRQWPVQYHVWI